MRKLIKRVISSTVLIRSILFIAATLRAPITVVGPMTDIISGTLHLGTAEAGLLTTLPLLAFAVVSPFAGWLGRYGLEKALFGAMILILAGIAVRSAGSASSLYLGTCIIGCGIAVGNVLLPSLTKREFPDEIASLTAMYAVTMSVAAACASFIAVPLERASAVGWPLALGATAALPMCAATWVWKFDSWTGATVERVYADQKHRVWSSVLAWQVTLFLGLNSFVYYVTLSWLPSILTAGGYSAEQAGSLHGLMQIAGAIPALALIPFINRTHHHCKIAVAASVLSAAGLVGLTLQPGLAALWTLLLGSGTGTAMVLGLAFLGLRASCSRVAAVLSGMAQSVGYTVAAAGPPLIGALRVLVGSWTIPLLACAALCVLMGLLGVLAGRPITIATVIEG
ncbi:MFS transporter [Bradyrhizobium sp. 27S5]|uniref:MFS transporter n=1 Tax=Bradyrhizobium sp. 27S5 TaxID=3139728 RepID=UPI0030CD0B76